MSQPKSNLLSTRTLTAPLKILFSAKGAAPLLLALLYYPDKVRSILPERLHPWINSPVVIRALSVLLGLSVLRGINNKVSQWAVNNWKPDAKFIKSQEIVLITGGSSGIGEIMSNQFAKLGVKVVILDLNPPKTAVAANVAFYQCDVTSPENIAAVAEEIRKDHGDPTVLINNAGIGLCRTILGAKEQHIRKTFEVNTISHFWMVREFLPAMIKKDHGHVVTIASMASYVVHAQNVDYSCTKASAQAFHEGLGAELRSRYNAPNVRTTVVNPIWIRTPMIAPLIAKPGFNDPVLEPEDVAATIVNQVVSGRGGQLILPKEVKFLSTLRAWPYWMQTRLSNRMAHVLDFSDEEAEAAYRG
ncbi:NAD(P)-binding protein [Mollisia scopiformis]|uniref:Short-chain dehydrogenase/reductase 3 n=1 Tax=Mollisia scopiformis TaxID=149040 RepID=A0A194XJN4_MOLSC|nr:NAD(P)-binding protein [Mollisia scopiformis]KUJ20450.1 NAD(P)-binding protein [Mollisia scopiformis]